MIEVEPASVVCLTACTAQPALLRRLGLQLTVEEQAEQQMLTQHDPDQEEGLRQPLQAEQCFTTKRYAEHATYCNHGQPEQGVPHRELKPTHTASCNVCIELALLTKGYYMIHLETHHAPQ